jgi:hypothetical protein
MTGAHFDHIDAVLLALTMLIAMTWAVLTIAPPALPI